MPKNLNELPKRKPSKERAARLELRARKMRIMQARIKALTGKIMS